MLRLTHAPTKAGVRTLDVSPGFRVLIAATRPYRSLVITTSLEVDPVGAAFVKKWLLALAQYDKKDVSGMTAATRKAFKTYDVRFTATPAEAV